MTGSSPFRIRAVVTGIVIIGALALGGAACERDPVGAVRGQGGAVGGAAGAGGIGIGVAGAGAGVGTGSGGDATGTPGVAGAAGSPMGNAGTDGNPTGSGGADGQGDGGVDAPSPICLMSCPDDGAASCRRSGACDSTGACLLYPTGTRCQMGSCQDNAVVGEKVCDGKGACLPAPTTVCVPFVCDGTTRRCVDRCTDDGHCAGGWVCVDGSCQNPRPGRCTANEQCASGFCVDGVCCNTACTGSCRSCALPASVGVCTAAAAGSQDPHAICQRGTACGQTGTCDGSGACSVAPSGTGCRPGSCQPDVGLAFPPSICDGVGNCVTPMPVSCAPGTCTSDGRCGVGPCTSDVACAAGRFCASDGTCMAQQAVGQKCTRNAQCLNNTCADGVCCSTSCAARCASCVVPGRLGTCSPVPAGAADPRGQCLDLGPASCTTNGTCNGAGDCARYPTGTLCAVAACGSSEAYMPAAACNGIGVCVRPAFVSCAPYACDPIRVQCRPDCTSLSDCALGSWCEKGRCVSTSTP